MTASTVGGVWTHAIELTRALERHGVRVTLAAMGAPLSDAQAAEARSLSNLTLHARPYRLEWMDRPWRDIDDGSDWLLQLEHDAAPDIVHLNEYARGSLPWRAPTLVVGHSCVLSWWQATRGEPAPARWARYAGAVRAGLAAADLVAAPTEWMAAALQYHYGPIRRILVLPGGRDPFRFSPAPKERFVFSTANDWEAAINLAALDKAADRLPWSVFVAGATAHQTDANIDLGAAHGIGCLGPGALARWYASAAIFALPASYEPFGLAVVEAAFSGCALVLGDIPSLREVWDDAALFVPPDDAAALHAALSELIADEQRRSELAAAASRRAFRYTASTMANRYALAYAELLAGRQAAVVAISE